MLVFDKIFFVFVGFLQEARDEIKEIVRQLSQLKYELQTDKEFHFFDETRKKFQNPKIKQIL